MTDRRETFDKVAELYRSVRPGVPAQAVEALFDALLLTRGDRVVEVGCGTGQLTGHLLAHGARVTAIEPGSQLANACESEHRSADLEIVRATFEDWSSGGDRYRAVTACQAAHWIDPAVFVERSVGALDPDGGIGLLWHVDVSETTPFYAATQSLYDRYLPDADDNPPRTIPIHVAAYERTLKADTRFGPPAVRRFPWTRRFAAETYLGYLRSTSPVRMLKEDEREAFIAGHVPIIGAFGGSVERLYETVLLSAKAGRLASDGKPR